MTRSTARLGPNRVGFPISVDGSASDFECDCHHKAAVSNTIMLVLFAVHTPVLVNLHRSQRLVGRHKKKFS